MQTVLEVLKKTTAFFEEKGIESARLDAELLIAKGLDCKRLDLYLRFDQPVVDQQLQVLRDLVKRRGKHEPLQYIIGTVDFLDLSLKVDSRALIPRPETEELVAKLLEQWSNNPPKSVLDLGTGSGAIALAIAHKFPNTKVLAVDKCPEALALAKENAQNCQLGAHVTFVQSDWFESVDGSFDMILGNPPYLTENEWATAKPEVKDSEPYKALVAEDEGMADIKKILSKAQAHLNPGGKVILETGISQHDALKNWANSLGYKELESWDDLSGRERFFVATV